MATDTADLLLGLINRIRDAATRSDESVAEELVSISEEMNELWMGLMLNMDAIAPVLYTGNRGNGGQLSVLDLCYTAFMNGRNGIPQDPEAARCDWMNDTQPLMVAGVERIRKDVQRNLEYARGDRSVQAAIERERHING